jgi:class 3 adenylate cyclase
MRTKRPRAAATSIIATALVAGCLAALLAGLGPGSGLAWKAYDLLLGLAAPSPVPGDFLVISGEAEAEGRHRGAAESLAVLRILDEFGASRVVMEGPAYEGGAGEEDLASLRSTLPDLVDEEGRKVADNIRSLFAALRSGSIPTGELARYVDGLVAIVDKGGERVKEAVAGGPSPIRLELDGELQRLGASTAGLPAPADADGILRRLPLVTKESGQARAGGDLAFLVDRLGASRFVLLADRLVLKGARLADGQRRDLSVRMDGEGRALVPWTRPGSKATPRELKLSDLLLAQREEEGFISVLSDLAADGHLTGEGAALLSRYRNAERLRDTRGPADPGSDWREERRAFFDAALAYFRENHEAGFIAALEVRKNTSTLGAEELARIDGEMAGIGASYRYARAAIEGIAARRAGLQSSLGSATVFLSLSPPPSVQAAQAAASAPARPARARLDSFGKPADAAMASALLAASLLAGRQPWSLPFGPVAGLGCALALLAALAALRGRPPVILVSAIALAAAGLAASALAFIAFRVFVTPLPLVLGPLAAGLVAWVMVLAGAAAAPSARRAELAVAAFKAFGLARGLEGLPAGEAAAAVAAFREEGLAAIGAEGGHLASGDGSVLLAYFPAMKGRKAPAERAMAALAAMSGLSLPGHRGAAEAKDLDIRAGLDFGDCLVLEGGSGRAGPLLFGAVADLALRLADLNRHYGTKNLATGDFLAKAGRERGGNQLCMLEVESTGKKASVWPVD